MALNKAGRIWMDGKWVAWDDAKIHVLSHVAHYGTAVFEGIRAYGTPQGPAIFRLEEHIDRFIFSAKVYRMDKELKVTRDQIRQACVEVVAINDLRECYIRPLIYRGYENLGVNPFGNPVNCAVAAFPWTQYLGPDALQKGVAVKVGSWQRMAPNTLPAMAKAAANYMNSALLKMEAKVDGYEEAIALDVQGFVSEGSGQNVFAVVRGELLTPPLTSSILAGITRDSIIRIARDMGLTVREEQMPREMLYLAEELFYTGTAVEVSPITSVDRITVGTGECGPVTKKLQEAFFGIVKGTAPDRYQWLTTVPQVARVK